MPHGWLIVVYFLLSGGGDEQSLKNESFARLIFMIKNIYNELYYTIVFNFVCGHVGMSDTTDNSNA